MADTFEDSWRRARLHFPGVPALLVRDWVQDAYTRACEYRGGGWSFLRKSGFLTTLASRSLLVTLTQGSATVTSVGLFVATDAGRQLRLGSDPVYTIASFTDVNTITLDQPYAATGGADTATILDAYFTTPTDFKRFLIIGDPYQQRIIPFWFNQDALGVSDPNRLVSDNGPLGLIAHGPSTAVATLGQMQYEYWPYPTSARQYPYLYYRQAERLADASTFPGVFANRSDLFKLGAQLQAAEWPGTADQKNPYYNLALADRLEKKWNYELQLLSLADDNQAPEDLLQADWAARYGGLYTPDSYLRRSDATVLDYI